jgi:hypothetical protein
MGMTGWLQRQRCHKMEFVMPSIGAEFATAFCSQLAFVVHV